MLKTLHIALAIITASFGLASADVGADPQPNHNSRWPRRMAPPHTRPWKGLARSPRQWPTEPDSPSSINTVRFAKALGGLCTSLTPTRSVSYAKWILKYAHLHKVDPFLMAAVIHRRSRCFADKEGDEGVGLGQIHIRAHERQIHDGWYRYWTLEDGQWNPRELLFNRFPFTRQSLRRPEANIYFTAALLYIYSRQCRAIDSVHRGEPHRHFVSHFLWGDRVLGTRFEDLVLQTRRRMLERYSGAPSRALAAYREFPLHSPLEGAPRKISSPYNDRRDLGRRHKGLDFLSDYGEPVRSVADGVVVFAGIDHPRRGASNLTPARAKRVSKRWMGRGGLFVLVDHGKGFTTGYFHLAGYTVKQGDRVRGGELIGFVGSTGIKESPPHLHFEMRRNRSKFDPTSWIRPMVAPPECFEPAKKKKRKKRGKRRPVA